MMINSGWRAPVAATVVAAVLGLTASIALAQDKVRLGALRFTSHSGAFVAFEKGYFEEEGLDVEFHFFQAAAPMAVAIASGDIDYGVTAISGGLINLAGKGAIKVIGGALVEETGVDGQKILVSNQAWEDGVTTPAMLAGRSFGITQTGSSFHYMISQIAAKEGFALSEVSLKPLQKVGVVIGALKSGQIDGWTIVPHIAKALAGGGAVRIIGDVADYIDTYQVTTIFTSSANASDKRDLTERFLRAYSKGIADFNANMVDRTEGEEGLESTTRLIHRYVYTSRPYEKAAPSIRNGSMRLQPGARLNLASVRHQLEWFKSEGLVGEEITIEQLVDTSYVEIDD